MRDKTFNIAKNQKYDEYQCGLASMVYKFFDKNTSGSGIKNKIVSNNKLAKEFHKPIIKINNWGADFADTQLISKFNKGFRFLLCVIDIYSKYAWVIPLKDKKVITNTNAFQKTLNESTHKPNKTWVNKGGEFSTRSMYILTN